VYSKFFEPESIDCSDYGADVKLDRRGVAVYLGKDVAKLKSKGGKWKYCSEEQMLEVASKFIPYRQVNKSYCTATSC